MENIAIPPASQCRCLREAGQNFFNSEVPSHRNKAQLWEKLNAVAVSACHAEVPRARTKEVFRCPLAPPRPPQRHHPQPRTENSEPDKGGADTRDKHGRSSQVFGCPGQRMPARFQKVRELFDAAIQGFQREHECDREDKNQPLGLA